MRSAPVYDAATFLAMLSNISVTVIFTVRVESNFDDAYQEYCNRVLSGTGSQIDAAKSNMFSVMAKEIIYIMQTQAVITICAFMLIMIFAPVPGFGGLVAGIFPVLCAGYFVLYIMYGAIIFLYYFNDGKGAMMAALTFLIVTFAGSLAAQNLSPGFYGIGLFTGAVCAWTVAFFRLRYIERNLERLIFLRGD
jgi:uncharacterized membrane protein